MKKKINNKNKGSVTSLQNSTISKNSKNSKTSKNSIHSIYSLLKKRYKNNFGKKTYNKIAVTTSNSNSSVGRPNSHNLLKAKKRNSLTLSDFRDEKELSPKLFKEIINKLHKRNSKNKNYENDNNKIYQIKVDSSKSANILKKNNNNNPFFLNDSFNKNNYIITIMKKPSWEKSKPKTSRVIIKGKISSGNISNDKFTYNTTSECKNLK